MGLCQERLDRFKSGQAGVEHADPSHPTVDRVGKQRVQRGEVMPGVYNAARSRPGRRWSEQRSVRGLTDADVETKYQWTAQIGRPIVVSVLGLERGEVHTAGQGLPGVVEERGFTPRDDRHDAGKAFADVSSNGGFFPKF